MYQTPDYGASLPNALNRAYPHRPHRLVRAGRATARRASRSRRPDATQSMSAGQLIAGQWRAIGRAREDRSRRIGIGPRGPCLDVGSRPQFAHPLRDQ